ncbi:hypothetical protein IT575_14500 [bacterium]|nr:hypothetical protein [bacterium]
MDKQRKAAPSSLASLDDKTTAPEAASNLREPGSRIVHPDLQNRATVAQFNQRISATPAESLGMLEKLYQALLDSSSFIQFGVAGESYDEVCADIRAGKILAYPLGVAIWIVWLACIVMVALAFVQSLQFNAAPNYDWSFWAKIAAVTGSSALVTAAVTRSFLHSKQLLTKLSEKLPESGLIARLAEGPRTVAELAEAVPALFRAVFFNVNPRSWRDVSKVLRHNLDWLLEAPPKHIRPDWIITICFAVAFLVLLGLIAGGLSLAFSRIGTQASAIDGWLNLLQTVSYALQLIPLSYSVLVASQAGKSEIFRRLLLPYIRDHINADESELARRQGKSLPSSGFADSTFDAGK